MPTRVDYDQPVSGTPRFRDWLVRRGGASRRQRPPLPQPSEVAVSQTELAGSALYSKWVLPGSLVFDVGANVGIRSRTFLELGARVVAVEPQPDCARALRALSHDRLSVEQVALGAAPGTAELRIASENTISSMADDWIDRVQRSGRFAAYSWPETISVEVWTLDGLIDRYGVPDFCKIDVEGYEPEVVRGLSQSLPLLSFEFAVECADRAHTVLDSLDELGFCRFNFSGEETFSLVWDGWQDLVTLRNYLDSLSTAALAWGDIYAAA